MRLSIDVTLDYVLKEPADILLQIEAAATPDQRLEHQSLTIWSDHPVAAVRGEDGIGQRCWVRADHGLLARYEAVVWRSIGLPSAGGAGRDPGQGAVGRPHPYLLPSRYCESDRLEGFVRSVSRGFPAGWRRRWPIGWRPA